MRCPFCSWDSKDDPYMKATVHHIVPGRENGGKLKGNTISICQACHIIIDYPHSLEKLRDVSDNKTLDKANAKIGASRREAERFYHAHKRIVAILDTCREEEWFSRLMYYRSIIDAINRKLIQKVPYLDLKYVGMTDEDIEINELRQIEEKIDKRKRHARRLDDG